MCLISNLDVRQYKPKVAAPQTNFVYFVNLIKVETANTKGNFDVLQKADNQHTIRRLQLNKYKYLNKFSTVYLLYIFFAKLRNQTENEMKKIRFLYLSNKVGAIKFSVRNNFLHHLKHIHFMACSNKRNAKVHVRTILFLLYIYIIMISCYVFI